MKIENQVCSLEQAKKLKELRVKQDSAFVWGLLNLSLWYIPSHRRGKETEVNTASAFTVAELGLMLPCAFDTMRSTEFVWKEGWKPYDNEDNLPFGYETYFNTEAEARASILIYVIENKLIKVDEVNQRLIG